MKEEILLMSIFMKENKDLINKIYKIEYGEDENDDDETLYYFDDFERFTELAPYINSLIKEHKLVNIYEKLLDGFYFTSSVDLQDVVMLLCKYYISSHYERNDFVVVYIKDHSFKEVYSFFKDNEAFALSLIANYYLCKVNDYYIDESLFDSDQKIEFYKCTNKIMFITDHLRFLYEQCINELIECGLGTDDALSIMYLIIKGRELDLKLDVGIENISELSASRDLMTRVIYSDLFEDSASWSDDYPHAKEMKNDIKFNIAYNHYSLPNSELGVEMLSRFTDLIFDPAAREYNRNALDENQFKVLKRVNPIYPLERVMIGYENK